MDGTRVPTFLVPLHLVDGIARDDLDWVDWLLQHQSFLVLSKVANLGTLTGFYLDVEGQFF